MTALAVLDPLTAADAAPFGPRTVIEELTRTGYETVARLYDEAMAAIAVLAETEARPAEPAPVLRMTERPAVTTSSWRTTAA